MKVTPMAAKDASLTETLDDSKWKRSGVRFATYALADCLTVAKAIHEQGGGTATLEQLAAFLNYAGTNNGAFLARLASARSFGLIQRYGDKHILTQLARTILMPVYDWEAKEAMVQAFLNVELFSKVYEEYKGKELPPEAGLKNALQSMFGVAPARVDRAYRALMDSAEEAGFFATRGTRTHLIVPTIQKGGSAPGLALVAPQADADSPERITPTSADAPVATTVMNMHAVKAKYANVLIDLMQERAKSTGQIDEELMSRIEKLLEEKA
jgi:hypothetical protein